MAEVPPIKFDAEAIARALEPMMESLATGAEMYDIFQRATAEFWRARELHGDQTDRPLGIGKLESYLNDVAQAAESHREARELYVMDNEDAANLARQACQDAGDDATWTHIVGEEFFEALAEEDPAAFEVEAIQAIAMLINMIMAARKSARA